ncbi:Uncharacterised protein [uncultured archaeon]|nr:Uncharacterised protein [uncultured archaeon]
MVPWMRVSAPIFLASCSKILMNVSPTIFLLVSGSVTPLSASRNLSSASTLTSDMSLKSSSILSDSNCLMRPEST